MVFGLSKFWRRNRRVGRFCRALSTATYCTEGSISNANPIIPVLENSGKVCTGHLNNDSN